MIDIRLGQMGSDCTSPYYVTISKPMCVGDFIEEWLKEHPHEWGRFGIYQGGWGFGGNPGWEYRYGQLLSKPDDKWFSRKIKEVKGLGGWSNSDFIFVLEEEDNFNEVGDNRFKIIGMAKADILNNTNIEDSKEEMECLDNFLFRCWQMGWLDKYCK